MRRRPQICVSIALIAFLFAPALAPAADPNLGRWIAELRDRDPLVRSRAAKSIGSLGARAKAAIPALVRSLNDPQELVCNDAQDALVRVGPAAIPSLITALGNRDNDVRYRAAAALGRIEPKEVCPVAALVKALSDPDPKVRHWSALSLGRLGSRSVKAVPALIGCLKDKERSVRQSAAVALGCLGPDAKEAVAELLIASRLKENDNEILSAVRVALEKIDPAALKGEKR